MRQKFINILLTLLGLVAWSMIAITDPMMLEIASAKVSTNEMIRYSIILVISAVYIQWLIGYFLTPLDGLTNEKKNTLLIETKKEYKNYFRGTVSAGYAMIFLHIYSIFEPMITPKPLINFVNAGMFFIILGVIAKARTNFKVLCRLEKI